MAATRKSANATDAISCARPPAGVCDGARLPPRAARSSNEPILRQCAATRNVRPVSELVRFVAGPDDKIYPDLAGKLPGRGIWVTADRLSVAKAVKSQAFSRAMKRKTQVPGDLADTVERLMEQRVIEALSLANKAGTVVTGFDKVAALVERGRAIALVHATDAASGGIEKLDRKMRAISRSSPGPGGPIVADCLTIDQMSLSIGRSNVVHAGLSNGGAATRFIATAVRLVDYRNGVGTCSAPRRAAKADENRADLRREARPGSDEPGPLDGSKDGRETGK